MSTLDDLISKAKEHQFPHELALGWLRYEALRTVSPRKFAEIHRRNLSGENFDTMIDQIVIEKNKP